MMIRKVPLYIGYTDFYMTGGDFMIRKQVKKLKKSTYISAVVCRLLAVFMAIAMVAPLAGCVEVVVSDESTSLSEGAEEAQTNNEDDDKKTSHREDSHEDKKKPKSTTPTTTTTTTTTTAATTTTAVTTTAVTTTTTTTVATTTTTTTTTTTSTTTAAPVTTTTTARTTPAPVVTTTVDEFDAYADEILRLVNEERRSRGLPEYTTNEKLNQMAMVRANEISQSFSHTRLDGSGLDSLFAEYGVQWWAIGENIAGGYSTPSFVMDGWMNSPLHEANILAENFSSMGIGIVRVNGTMFWVQIFASIR